MTVVYTHMVLRIDSKTDFLWNEWARLRKGWPGCSCAQAEKSLLNVNLTPNIQAEDGVSETTEYVMFGNAPEAKQRELYACNFGHCYCTNYSHVGIISGQVVKPADLTTIKLTAWLHFLDITFS